MKTARENREVPLPVRFSRTECRLLKQAADSGHEYVSAYIRRIVLTETDREDGGK